MTIAAWLGRRYSAGVEPENIEERVTALESQVGELNRRVRASEQDAQAARVLAGAADRDVANLGGELRDLRGDLREFRGEFGDLRGEFGEFRGEFSDLRGEFRDFRRATVAGFNALREDMNDRFSQVNDRFSQVDNGFIEMRAKFDAAAAGQQQIVQLISGMIDDRGEPGQTRRSQP